MRAFTGLLLATALAASCGTPSYDTRFPGWHVAQDAQDPQEPLPTEPELEERIDYDHILDMGTVLRSPDRDWGAHLTFPIGVGLTSFDLSNISIDNLTTISVVPTFEFIVPLDESRRWTLLPFVGLGGAVQLGDVELVGNKRWIGLLTGGVEVMRWQPFAERYTSILRGRVRYDAALTSRDGLLGDWGSFELIGELRGAFGDPHDPAPRFEPGIYAQGISYFDAIELEIDGVTPTSIHNQLELGISLGTTSRWELIGFGIPRIFVGFRFEEDLETLFIRFGRL